MVEMKECNLSTSFPQHEENGVEKLHNLRHIVEPNGAGHLRDKRWRENSLVKTLFSQLNQHFSSITSSSRALLPTNTHSDSVLGIVNWLAFVAVVVEPPALEALKNFRF